MGAAIPARKPATVVLVEDDDGDAIALRRAFAKCRIDVPVVRAVDGIDALDLLHGRNGRSRPERPYVLLVDLNMPRMNGIELIASLRADESLRRSVVFMLTTSKREEDKAAAYDLHVAGYIFKQADGDDFGKLASMLNAYWRIVDLPT